MLAQSLKNSIAQDNKELGEAKAAKAAAADEKYLSDLSTDCQAKASDWEVSTKSRGEELQALADAKKVISEMTGGAEARAYGLIQQTSSAKSSSDAGEQIVSMLQSLGKKNGDVAMAQLAMRVRAAVSMQTGSGADPFAKVKGMISEMIDKLVAQAAEEASHKAFCDKEMGESQAKIEDHTTTIDKFTTRKDKAVATIEKLKESISTLQSELASIAKQQAEMDQMRADQKAAFAEAKKDFEEGIEGLTMALQILRDYYAEKEESFVQQPETSVHSKASGAATGIIG